MPNEIARRDLIAGAGAALAAAVLPIRVQATSSDAPEDPLAGRWLAFDDSFATLDPAIWNAGRKATTFDSGHYGRAAFARRDGEEGVNPYAIVDDAAASGGKALQITARYIGRPMQVPAYYGNQLPEFQWISGNIQTAKADGTVIKGWRRGYFEARMRFPRHPLTWPGFWLMNGRSILHPTTSIELDIVEHKGFEPDLYGTYLHEWGKPGEHHEGFGVAAGVDLTRGYYRYGMLVEGELCIPYFERKPVLDPATRQPLAWRIGRTAEFDANGDVFWPLITLALRSDVPYPAPLQPEDHMASLRVDYVRVYA